MYYGRGSSMEKMPLNYQSMIILFLVLMIFLFTSLTNAEDMSFKPIFKPEITISRTSETIAIDGEMTESVWSTATMVNNFSERYPGDQTKPSVETEVYTIYDNNNLYVFFKCFDNPDDIRATKSQRDQFQGNDMVGVDIDTYGEAALAYEFYVNPYGVQLDMLWSAANGNEDHSFDMVWESSAKITLNGYQVEIAIPFSSIRFPNRNVQEWRVNFTRIRPRESDYRYTWAARDRNNPCWVCQLGILRGLENIEQKKGVEILPSLIGYQTGQLLERTDPTSGFNNEDVDGEFSISSRYSLSSDIIVEGAYNPDFSQIEADATQIDINSATALYYPERRPYFQEGSDLFQTIWGTFYTRTINDPQVTTKMTARLKNSSLAFLSAIDENSPYMIPLDQTNSIAYPGKSYVNVLRGLKTFRGNSQIGFMYTDRRFEESGYNLLYSIDGNIYLTKKLRTAFQIVGTNTKEPNDTSFTTHLEGVTFDNGKRTAVFDGESYNGLATVTELIYSDKKLYLFGLYKSVSRAYRTVTGYDPTINYHGTTINAGYTFYPEHTIFERIQLWNGYEQTWNFDNQMLEQKILPRLRINLRWAQTFVGFELNWLKEYWQQKYFDNIFYGGIYLETKPSNKISLELFVYNGDGLARYVEDGEGNLGVKGKRYGGWSSLILKPIDRLTIEPRFEYVECSAIDTDRLYYKGYITRTKLQYQASKELSIRLVTQYNDFSNAWDIDPLLTYRLNSFTVFYLGSTYDYNQYEIGNENIKDWAMSSRQFFMKIQYLVQL